MRELERQIEGKRHQAEKEGEKERRGYEAKKPRKKKSIWYKKRRDSDNSELRKRNLP